MSNNVLINVLCNDVLGIDILGIDILDNIILFIFFFLSVYLLHNKTRLLLLFIFCYFILSVYVVFFSVPTGFLFY